MPYPEYICAPMRQELTAVGFEELKSPEAVDQAIPNSQGTTLLVLNSVCGCAAGTARPGVKLALNHGKKPSKLLTVFAGQDLEATAQARKYTVPYPPSSPSIALFKDGKLVHFIERHHIEGRSAEMIAEHLQQAFEEFC
ncbi:MAG: BrxA/BrxB family bacilliredoxin [Bacteroidota bacterium]|uniref:BrxA/BrxB family bacilliredoxin n=1 Tax=Candidatus Pollutiaquabacter sp. TaxID=3416354 RepID=UPI001A50AB53|nr:BrxA/BrxB family bacilliredoxin [Bacteroidota bacterium]MBL7950060.1 BrxA/BrxB family bacilliredoxin [Bacteroidia bacterium]MBP7268657.1 BrxA/BrxB family bacilliredoxin [Bacteroidia bacterium]MBP7436331.1 BrxA/BrxB family bacilliredoxin [Bacteroidia bacterium]MBP7728103.1 BrxA/BrxB family bacilliredoxin [Bacteroidia bacterium]